MLPLLLAAALQLAGTSAAAAQDIVASYSELGGKPYTVGYDGRSMRLGGKPALLLSGSVHYVRSTPEMWPEIFAKMKASGMNAVESYVFWNYHVRTLDEHNAGTADYSGRGNVTLFLELAAKADLFVIWRIGPYICAEWPGGGMPDWLRQIPGMHARSASQPYQDVCTKWMHDHIEYVRPHFAENGGPIIMTQMENELSGPSNTPYVDWLGELATELKTGLPWIMCHGAHANNTIETCNGCDCASFVSGLAAQNQPAMWSEDEQWFDRFEQGASVRATGNVGYGVAKFIAAGGSMHNFYMFHGGTMWGNWSTTVRRTRLTPSYANTANLASDSIVYNPKYKTIAELHLIVAKYAATILHTPIAALSSGGNRQSSYQVTLNGTGSDPALTFAFNEGSNATTLSIGGQTLPMAAGSARAFDASLKPLWYSEPGEIDGVGEPYHDALGTPLHWQVWKNENSSAPDSKGTWYGTSFALDSSLPAAAQVSVNLTGFGQGNLFLNGVHVAYFNLEDGSCANPPGGVNGHGSCLGYVESRCGKPTQDTYHVPPEWLVKSSAGQSDGAMNEMMVWSDPRLPNNVTEIDPRQASVVYRVDPPAVREQVEALLAASQQV